MPGIYFFDDKVVDMAKALKPSVRGELEITDLNRLYLETRRAAGRDSSAAAPPGWTPARPTALADATQFVQVIQQRQGLKIACPEEIAFLQGRIDRAKLGESIRKYANTPYGEYLASL